MTEKEHTMLAAGRCPVCGYRGFLLGPRGGAAINIECGSVDCSARFNVTPMGWGQIAFAERIYEQPGD